MVSSLADKAFKMIWFYTIFENETRITIFKFIFNIVYSLEFMIEQQKTDIIIFS